jgi:hypothetical protein
VDVNYELTRARLLAAVFTQMANTMQVGRG